MTPAFGAQRRADEFDSLIEGTSTSERAARDSELLTLVGAMRSLPEVHARPEFVSDLRAQLMAEAETALAPADVSRLRLPERRTKRERRIAAVVGGIAIAGATTSVALASQSALPGESLYPIKRVIESAHSGVSVGDAAKGAIMIDNASSRLDEAKALSQDPGFGDDQRIAETLSTFTEQATDAADLLFADYARTGRQSSIADLRDFASSGLDQLEALEPLIPVEARDELISAAAVLAQIDSEAAQRCPACGGTPIDTIPPSLLAAGSILVPAPPVPAPVVHPSKSQHAKGDKGPGKDHQPLPDISSDHVGPGSVHPTDPGSQPSLADPLKALTDSLTGGADHQSPSSDDTRIPVVGEALDGVGELLQGVLDPLTGKPAEKP